MFTSQNMAEQKPEKCLIEDYLPNNELPVWQNPLCAWCLSEQGIPAGEGSHGICKSHANRLLLQQKILRSRRIVTTA